MRGDKNNGLYTKDMITEMICMRKDGNAQEVEEAEVAKGFEEEANKEILMALYEEEKLQQSSACR